MNKALSIHRNKRWKDTRHYRKFRVRLSLGHAMAVSVCARNIANISAIRSAHAKTPEDKVRKSAAIASAVINNAIAMNKALYWWRNEDET